MTIELQAPASEQTRARLSRQVGSRRTRRCEPLLRGLRLGRAHGVPPPDVVGHPLAALEDADPVPRQALPGRHLRRPRQRSLGPPAQGRIRGARVRRRRARGDGRDRDRPGGVRLPVAGRAARAAPCGRASRAHRRSGLHRPRRFRSASRSRIVSSSLGRGARHRGGLGEVQPLLLASRLPRLPRVLLLADVHGAALDEADRGLRRLGARDDAGDTRRNAAQRDARRGSGARPLSTRPLPGARDPGHRGRDLRSGPRDRSRRGDRW